MSKLARRLVNIYKSLRQNLLTLSLQFSQFFFLFLERIGCAGAGGAEFIHLSSSEILSSIGLDRSLTISHYAYDIIYDAA